MRRTQTIVTGAAILLALAGCGSAAKADQSSGVYANQGATIGIAMPTKVVPRWVNDGNQMVSQFMAMGYKTDLENAETAADQAAQVDKMIANGDKLLVIASVDGRQLKTQLDRAHAKGIKVIAYDRLINGSPYVDYYATFDNQRVGTLQGTQIVDQLGLADKNVKGPFNIELFAGDPNDNNAKFYFNGAIDVLKPYFRTPQNPNGKLIVPSGEMSLKSASTKNWDPKVAQLRMNQLLTADYQSKKIDAVLSPFDGLSVAMIQTLQAAGYGSSPDKPLPVMTGQDAQLDSMKLIIHGHEQTATVYKDTRELAKVAVQQGNALLTGTTPIYNDTTSYDNGVKKVRTYLLQPIAIDKTNFRTLLVDGGYYTAAQLGLDK